MSKKNWKQQFMRMKQLADQNLGRAEKSEVVTEDLHHLEKRIELVGKVCHSTHKKLQGYLVSTGADAEKRLKKIPEQGLSVTMIEASTLLGDTLMGTLFKTCGDAQFHLARELMTHEMEVESHVMGPLHTVLENDIPSIQRSKKHLSKLVLDMDAAKAKMVSAQKQYNQGGLSSQKMEAAKEELEDMQMRVTQARDQFATEMLSFTARESEFSNIMIELLEAQRRYHQRAMEVLERLAPQMQEDIAQHHQMPVYNFPLEDHLRRTNRDIAMVIENCVVTLLAMGMEEEGLFRIAGGASKVKKLKAAFDSGEEDMQEYCRDVHCIAGALKLYLRELPEPLMTYELYDEWMHAAHLPPEQRLQALWVVMKKLPEPHYNNFRYLIKFFSRLAEHSEVNKMSPSNIAIVIGPNMIWPPGDGGPSVVTTSTHGAIIEAFITNADWFFPEDVDFLKTSKGMASMCITKRRSAQGPVRNSVLNPKKSEEPGSLGSALSMAHHTLTAPLSAVNDNHQVAQPVRTNNSPQVDQAGESSPLQPRFSVDSGIGSSGQEAVVVPNYIMGVHGTPPPYTRFDSSLAHSHATKMLNSKGDQNCVSEPVGSGPWNVVSGGEPVARYISPASQPPPPRSVHSDMYNTVFALQSLGDQGWSDYLTRVRTLWDGHMSKRLSVGSAGGASECPAKPEVDFNGCGLSDTPPGTLNAPPAGLETGSFSASPASPSVGSLTSGGSPSASTASLTVESPSGGSSPASNRRMGKKPAPPPPAIPDRPSMASGQQGQERSASPHQSCDSLQVNIPAPTSATGQPDRPTAPPTVAEKPGRPSSENAERYERPRGPPPERPQGKPPQKPEKPEKPQSPLPKPDKPEKPLSPPVIEKLYPVLDTGEKAGATRPESAKFEDSSGVDSAGQRHASVGSKPPRPQPRPPPPPRTKTRGGSDRSTDINLEEGHPQIPERKSSSRPGTGPEENTQL